MTLGVGDDQYEHDHEPQAGCEEVLPEEDRPRLAEHREERDEDLVERLERGEEHQDQHQPERRPRLDRGPDQGVAER